MQNFLNIVASTLSVGISPMIAPKWKVHSRRSWLMKSPDRPVLRPSMTRSMGGVRLGKGFVVTDIADDDVVFVSRVRAEGLNG